MSKEIIKCNECQQEIKWGKDKNSNSVNNAYREYYALDKSQEDIYRGSIKACADCYKKDKEQHLQNYSHVQFIKEWENTSVADGIKNPIMLCPQENKYWDKTYEQEKVLLQKHCSHCNPLTAKEQRKKDGLVEELTESGVGLESNQSSNKSITNYNQRERERERANQLSSSSSVQNSNKTNYLPWILGGVGVLGLVGVVVYFVVRKKE